MYKYLNKIVIYFDVFFFFMNLCYRICYFLNEFKNEFYLILECLKY